MWNTHTMAGTSAGAAKRERCPKCKQFAHKSSDCGKAGRKPRPLMDRLWARVVKHGDDECWEWRGHHAGRNRDRPQIDKQYVVRVLLGLPKSDRSKDAVVVRHICDNPSCVNPTHLQIGTQSDNLGDMVERERSNRGEKHWNWKGGNSRNFREGRNRRHVV